MATRPTRPAAPTAAEARDPDALGARLQSFLLWQEARGYAEQTVKNRAAAVRVFIAWCEERAIMRAVEVTRPVLERYQRWLYHQYRKRDGQPLSFRSQYSRLSPLRAFFRYLARENLLLYNPAAELELPKLDKRLPKHVLTASEAERVINQTDAQSPLGLRDRAILETLYSTGMRRGEVVGLRLYDLDVERGTVMVRHGKGKRDRMIPIGERAVTWIERYLADVRPGLLVDPKEDVLFLTGRGEAFTPNHLTVLAQKYVAAAELGKTGACHLFRHTMATLMLEGGADIRYIQAMLGHAELSTTQIYTQVSIRRLKEVHTRTHPTAATSRRSARAIEADAGDERAARTELLSLLAAEEDDALEVDAGGDAGDE